MIIDLVAEYLMPLLHLDDRFDTVQVVTLVFESLGCVLLGGEACSG
jgi:hypothetical protein